MGPSNTRYRGNRAAAKISRFPVSLIMWTVCRREHLCEADWP